MIVIPRVLTGLLAEADPETQKRSALDFADHVLTPVRGGLRGGEVYQRYLVAAYRQLAEPGGVDDLSELIEARRAIYAFMGENGGSLEREGTVVLHAVTVAFHDAFEGAGVVASRKPKHLSRAEDVARDAQVAAGAHVAERHDDAAGDIEVAVRAAKWEEARWQLMRLIELVPAPGRA